MCKWLMGVLAFIAYEFGFSLGSNKKLRKSFDEAEKKAKGAE